MSAFESKPDLVTKYGTTDLHHEAREGGVITDLKNKGRWLVILAVVFVAVTAIFVYGPLDWFSEISQPAEISTQQSMSRVTKQKSLLLLRHAKSSWDDPSLADADRPLSKRGKRDAKRLGIFLQKHNIEVPQHIYSSSSVRTRSTLALVQRSWGNKVGVDFYSQLFDLVDYTEFLSQLDSSYQRVLIVGHNPAMFDFAQRILPTGAIAAFPTGTLCEVGWNILDAWTIMDQVPGKLEYCLTPNITN